MEQYKHKIKMRKSILYLLLILSFIFMVVIGEIGDLLLDARTIPKLVKSLQSLTFFGWIIYLIIHIRKCNKLLQNTILMEKNYVKENDERLIFIDGIAEISYCKIFNYCLFISTLIASFINLTIFEVLSIVLLFSIILKYLLLRYFNIKI